MSAREIKDTMGESVPIMLLAIILDGVQVRVQMTDALKYLYDNHQPSSCGLYSTGWSANDEHTWYKFF